MQRGLLSVAVLVMASCPVEAGCIDPGTLAHSTVGITRYFDDNERPRPGLLGVSGTAWFLSSTSMATAEHVAASMNLSNQSWKQVEVRTGDSKQAVLVRMREVAGPSTEKIAVIEMQTALSGAQPLQLRMEPLAPEEVIESIAYPADRLRVANGRFVRYGDSEKFAGTALLEMYDGNDRLVLDHGASGAPVVDCSGRAVALVSNLLTKTMQFMSSVIRVSTAWGDPNVVSVPIQVLKDISRIE
jgi:hypothetical protein